MFVGILIGLVLMLLCVIIAISPAKTSIKKVNISLCIGFAMFIASIFIGHYTEVESNHKYIVSYSIKKETIETSINSDNLSDIEKIELVKIATELNGELVEKQYKCGKWYSFGLLPKELKELKPIDITGGSK